MLNPGKKILMLKGVPDKRRYKDIARRLDKYLERLHSGVPCYWEARVENSGESKRNGVAARFNAGNGLEILDRLLPMAENEFTIYEFKRTGFAINNKNRFNRDGDEWYYVLPACHEGFHRDWKHDCICVEGA